MALASEDDGFREIQLSGKQLVFLFMAATVVSVVIFLCGVLVGRGVRAERAAVARVDVLNESPTADPVSSPAPSAAPDSDPREVVPPTAVVGEPEGADQKNAASVPVEEAPVAVDRSRSNAPAREAAAAAPAAAPPSKPATTPPLVASAPASTPAPPPATAKASASTPSGAKTNPAATAPPAAAIPAAEATRAGYAVQVAAVDVRGEADAMAKRLSDKGYTAYVEQPRGSNMYRVRVGTYRTRREAQVVAEKLKKEEKFNPWVTR